MAGGKSHFYSLEYEGENSIFNLLFTGGNAPPVPHGCTHADDLIYLFTTGLFDRKGDDLKISQDMSHLWANFATSGEFITRSNLEVPVWSEKDPHYLKIDVHEEICMTIFSHGVILRGTQIVPENINYVQKRNK